MDLLIKTKNFKRAKRAKRFTEWENGFIFISVYKCDYSSDPLSGVYAL